MPTHHDAKVVDPGGQLTPQLCFSMEWHVDVDLLTPDDFDKEFTGSDHDAIVPTYVHALTHKYPDLKIIEIGSAASGCSSHILERLGRHSTVPRFGTYHLSEMSSEHLQRARENLDDWKDSVLFRELDIHKDPATQGFVKSHYDLVVVTIHDNSDSKTALRYIRTLLKPHGQLAIIVPIQQSTKKRISNWNDLLGQNGFSGSKIRWSNEDDANAADHNYRVIITAIAEEEQHSQTHFSQLPALLFIEPEQGSHITDLILRKMKEQAMSASVSRVSIEKIPDTTGSVCIILLESEEPVLPAISETQWESVKQAVSKAQNVLWVGRGGAVTSPSPESHLVVGMGRTLRTEKPASRFVTLDLDMDDSPEQATDAILKILSHTMMCQVLSKENSDSEYALRGGRVLIPRIIPDSQTNNYVQQDLAAKYPLDLEQDASYLLVGGLGGLGRLLSTWMASNGAKHLIFLSRSGKDNPEAQQTVDELKAMGVRVVVCRCDVGDSASLEATIQQCRMDLPLIKGVIHGGMVLHNSTFSKMSHEAWKQTLQPKVAGTRNLCQAFSAQDATPLDFFIILSSAVGVIGNFGQANYAAASTYQDAVAHHYYSSSAPGSGLPVITIDVGMILSVGYVAENSTAAARLKKLGITGIHHEQFLAIIKSIIIDTMRRRRPRCCQTITGLGTQAMMMGGRRARTGDDEDWEPKLPFYFQDPKFSHLLEMHHNCMIRALAGQAG